MIYLFVYLFIDILGGILNRYFYIYLFLGLIVFLVFFWFLGGVIDLVEGVYFLFNLRYLFLLVKDVIEYILVLGIFK